MYFRTFFYSRLACPSGFSALCVVRQSIMGGRLRQGKAHRKQNDGVRPGSTDRKKLQRHTGRVILPPATPYLLQHTSLWRTLQNQTLQLASDTVECKSFYVWLSLISTSLDSSVFLQIRLSLFLRKMVFYCLKIEYLLIFYSIHLFLSIQVYHVLLLIIIV